ncbi:MAG: PQQ-dependent catabolism-associated beta-propeller protein [Flavipsychrobacter sp.]|jgi:small GTP-binding protein|nr:PQQ-dependent catabolism-associated beta-propeller protein [Flavipsychrobacter sp.]
MGFENKKNSCTLAGHAGGTYHAILSKDNQKILSCGDDGSIKLWTIRNKKCIKVFSGHTAPVYCVAWSNDERYIISGGSDNDVRLWDAETGNCMAVLSGHKQFILSVVWSWNNNIIISGGFDDSIRLWDAKTGQCLRVLEGHSSYVAAIALYGKNYFFSASCDRTIRLWDIRSGLCVQTFTGHECPIRTITVNNDKRLLYSGDGNGNVLTWDISELADIKKTDRVIIDQEQVQYVSAKVLLAGDTGVGKSGLAERLINNQFVKTVSSHARKAYTMESQTAKDPNGSTLHKETILWDLAGQPAYRLVHQLSMGDAALACVLFDNRSETNPFESPAYWSQVLDQSCTNTKIKKLLVASRIDVGGLPAGKERIEAFAKDNGFGQFIPTSANTGEGCTELVEAIRNAIPWDDIPKVTTTRTLAAMRDYMALLKSKRPAAQSENNSYKDLLTIGELHEGFSAYFGEKLSTDDFIAHLSSLEASDTIDLLVFHTVSPKPKPADKVLLDPTRLDAYASAILVAAKDEPDGPGHLAESKVLDGGFKLEPKERVTDKESERHLLWYVMETLISRDLALREQIKGIDYIVFPSQCTTELRYPGVAAFGVALGFAGPVKSIYATLIAQLAHYEGFSKRAFFQDAAAYTSKEGGRYIIRLKDLGHGKGELEISLRATLR